MNVTIQTINPKFIEHEGFHFLEFNGEYFKGCRRCGGDGHYSHNGEHSRCYECDNTSAKLGEALDSYEAGIKWCHTRALARANRIRKAEEKRMVEVRALEAKVAALPEDVREFLLNVELNEYDGEMDYYGSNRNENYEKDAFVRNMAEQVQYVSNARRPFTEKMIAAVRSNIAKRAAKVAEAEAHPAPEGRVRVVGEIVGTKVVEGDYGTAYKITVKVDEGYRVYVSIPKAQADQAFDEFYAANAEAWDAGRIGYSVWFEGSSNEPERFKGIKGRRIAFDAKLERSRDDKSFAFGSRPTKGEWLA